MNRAFLIIAIPAALVITAYILLAVYAGVQLTYFRIAGGVIGFGVAIYLVNSYLRRHKRGADPR
jgi:small neutral amino acid transporter SnatA (MarC family)